MATSKESMKTIAIGIPLKDIPQKSGQGCRMLAKIAKNAAESFKGVAEEALGATEAYAVLTLLEMMAVDEPELAMETLKGFFLVAGEDETAHDIQLAMECDQDEIFRMFIGCFLGNIRLRDIYGSEVRDPNVDPNWYM